MKNLLADTINLAPQGDFKSLQTVTVPAIIQSGITLILIVAAIAFFVMLVLGGVRWILSGGDKGQTEAARNQITAALVGLVIVFAAWAIIQLVGSLFGINIFNKLTLPSFNTVG